MRCQKCGLISFDWLDACSKCGHSLEKERELLGRFLPDNGDINWFQKSESAAAEAASAAFEPQAVPDISKVDVSDLVTESDESEMVDIEEKELLRAAEDEDFQKALEEIAT